MEEERESKEERGREGEKRKEEEREAVSYTTGHYRTIKIDSQDTQH